MSVRLTMGFLICASLLSSIVERIGTSTGSKTVIAGGGSRVLSGSSAVSIGQHLAIADPKPFSSPIRHLSSSS